jgi:hypothetical protein
MKEGKSSLGSGEIPSLSTANDAVEKISDFLLGHSIRDIQTALTRIGIVPTNVGIIRSGATAVGTVPVPGRTVNLASKIVASSPKVQGTEQDKPGSTGGKPASGVNRRKVRSQARKGLRSIPSTDFTARGKAFLTCFRVYRHDGKGREEDLANLGFQESSWKYLMDRESEVRDLSKTPEVLDKFIQYLKESSPSTDITPHGPCTSEPSQVPVSEGISESNVTSSLSSQSHLYPVIKPGTTEYEKFDWSEASTGSLDPVQATDSAKKIASSGSNEPEKVKRSQTFKGVNKGQVRLITARFDSSSTPVKAGLKNNREGAPDSGIPKGKPHSGEPTK